MGYGLFDGAYEACSDGLYARRLALLMPELPGLCMKMQFGLSLGGMTLTSPRSDRISSFRCWTDDSRSETKLVTWPARTVPRAVVDR